MYLFRERLVNEMEIENVKEKISYKETGKQLGIFLGICLPITWILMGIGYTGMQGEQTTVWAELLVTFACFMPALAAIIASLLTKEKFQLCEELKACKNLKFMQNMFVYK